jgi:hypothetical protein
VTTPPRATIRAPQVLSVTHDRLSSVRGRVRAGSANAGARRTTVRDRRQARTPCPGHPAESTGPITRSPRRRCSAWRAQTLRTPFSPLTAGGRETPDQPTGWSASALRGRLQPPRSGRPRGRQDRHRVEGVMGERYPDRR